MSNTNRGAKRTAAAKKRAAKRDGIAKRSQTQKSLSAVKKDITKLDDFFNEVTKVMSPMVIALDNQTPEITPKMVEVYDRTLEVLDGIRKEVTSRKQYVEHEIEAIMGGDSGNRKELLTILAVENEEFISSKAFEMTASCTEAVELEL